MQSSDVRAGLPGHPTERDNLTYDLLFLNSAPSLAIQTRLFCCPAQWTWFANLCTLVVLIPPPQALAKSISMSNSSDNKVKSLRQDLARELLTRAEKLTSEVEQGSYDVDDLSELAYILRNIRDQLVGNDARLSEVIGMSSRTIAATYNGESNPKYANFMRMLYGAKRILSSEISNPESQNINLGHSLRPYEPDAGMVRIRSNRSNIFLSDADIRLVQEIATRNNTQISAVISEALEQLAENRNLSLGRSPDQQVEITRNRVEIIRYSTALINALQEVLDYDPSRHHNNPPPSLRIDDDEYLLEIRDLVTELKKLNAQLETMTARQNSGIANGINRLGKHFDTFFSAYAKSLGTGAAGLTVAAVVALLHNAGVDKPLIDNIWQHWKPD